MEGYEDVKPVPPDPIEVMRGLARRGIFVHEPDFYQSLHPKIEGKMKVTAPFWGGVALVIDTCADVDIGRFCYFDDFVVMYSHIHHFGTDVRFYEPEPVPKKIGEFVYIQPRATILGACESIGAGSVILAGAVVLCNVGPGEIWAGNPAKKIGVTDIKDEWKKSLEALFSAPTPQKPTPGGPRNDDVAKLYNDLLKGRDAK